MAGMHTDHRAPAISTYAGFTNRTPRTLPRMHCMPHRAQPLALRAHCHGEKSPGYQELCTVTRQFSAFIGLHAYVAGHAILGSSYQDTDLSTGQVTGFPKGAG